MATPIRNFRISDDIWLGATKKASRLGIPLTSIIKGLLKSFAHSKNTAIYIDEGRIDLTPKIQKEINSVVTLASKQIKKRLAKKN